VFHLLFAAAVKSKFSKLFNEYPSNASKSRLENMG